MIVFKGITHILLGIALYIFVFGFNLLNLLFVILGSLFPDIDHPYSLLGKFNLFANFMKHRGITHTIVVATILSSILSLYEFDFGLAFRFGYLTHLIGDTLTPSGIMWLYPLKKKYYTLSKGNSLKGIEGIVFALCVMYLFLGKIF